MVLSTFVKMSFTVCFFLRLCVHSAFLPLQVSGWEEQLVTAAVDFVKYASCAVVRPDVFPNTTRRNNVRFAEGTGSILEVTKLLKVCMCSCRSGLHARVART
jgi:hypothetical protein